MFDKAMLIASREHLGIRDNGGKVYILHPIRVAMRLRTDDEDLMCIAALHDVIEDSDVTLDDLRSEGFSERVITALELLTHDPSVEYFDYIGSMRNNLDALRVKREDLRDNSDITRLKGLRQKDFDRMEKYCKAYKMIEEYISEFECSNSSISA